jgi:DNA-binding transcriptional regulator LsrR (DeoR family)
MIRLKKIEQYAIQWLDYHGYDSDHISKELNISETDINKFLEKNRLINNKNKIKTSSSVVGNIKNKNLMIVQSDKKESTKNSPTVFKPIKK